MPEPLYTQDSQVPVEQRIADASQRAIRGETSQARAAALGELAVIGDPSVLNTINEAVADTELQVRLAAVTAAQRMAQYHGDENGDVWNWLIQTGNGADAQVAAKAREGANELAQSRGEDLPFP
jgi:HEAT repeat protein